MILSIRIEILSKRYYATKNHVCGTRRNTDLHYVTLSANLQQSQKSTNLQIVEIKLCDLFNYIKIDVYICSKYIYC